jgi:hypothetical protein
MEPFPAAWESVEPQQGSPVSWKRLSAGRVVFPG